jgi:hypothetical protein
LTDEVVASRPAQMKNEPAQKLEMKDFSLAVGMMPLILWRVFGTTRRRPAIRLYQLRIMRKCAFALANDCLAIALSLVVSAQRWNLWYGHGNWR